MLGLSPLVVLTLLAAGTPEYSGDSVVNAASYRAGPLAPNTYVTIYGQNLSYVTRALGPQDLRADELPTALAGANVRVRVGAILAQLTYVSPTQINALVPANLVPGAIDIAVFREGIWGPTVKIELRRASPALFLMDAETVIGTHADGSLIDGTSPARPGETVVLYATGLGTTAPPQEYGKLALGPARLVGDAQFHIVLEGEELDGSRIDYAGIAPGFAGLYQINVRLPEALTANPEIRVRCGDEWSPVGLRLLVEPAASSAR